MITTASGQRTLSGEPAGSAVESDDKAYRYVLRRTWAAGPRQVWIMLNPSTADASADDATIRKITRFTKRWGFGGLVVVNLFALRATDPAELARHPDPVGSGNDEIIADVIRPCSAVVAAWGRGGHVGGHLLNRGPSVTGALLAAGSVMGCLGINKDGSPKHPLYCRDDSPLVPYPPTGLGVTP